MNQTSIEWCDFTVNPIRFRNKETGKAGHYCEKISPGCKNCYASRMQKGPYLSGLEFRVENRDKGELFFDEAVLAQVLRRRKPATIFWSDMTDLFGDWVPDEWIDRCAAVVALTPHLRHLWLTKRAKRMREYVLNLERTAAEWQQTLDGKGARRDGGKPFNASSVLNIRWLHAGAGRAFPDSRWPLPNLGLGVSVEDQKTADERIPDLLATPAAMRFVSLEPMLSDVVLDADWMYPRCRYCGRHSKRRLPQCEFSDCAQDFDGREHRLLDWAIVGGQTGPRARPTHPDWVRSIRDQCIAVGVPYFHKQNGEWSPQGDASRDRYEDVPVGDGTHHRMFRVGKKRAGRLLDGQVWDERPEGWG